MTIRGSFDIILHLTLASDRIILKRIVAEFLLAILSFGQLKIVEILSDKLIVHMRLRILFSKTTLVTDCQISLAIISNYTVNDNLLLALCHKKAQQED